MRCSWGAGAKLVGLLVEDIDYDRFGWDAEVYEDDPLPPEALRQINQQGYVDGASVGRAPVPDECPYWGEGFSPPPVEPEIERHLKIVEDYNLPPVEAWRLEIQGIHGVSTKRTMWLRKGSDFGRALTGMLRGYGPDAKLVALKKVR